MKPVDFSALVRTANLYVYDYRIFDHTPGCVWTDYAMGAAFLALSGVLAARKFVETPSAQFRSIKRMCVLASIFFALQSLLAGYVHHAFMDGSDESAQLFSLIWKVSCGLGFSSFIVLGLVALYMMCDSGTYNRILAAVDGLLVLVGVAYPFFKSNAMLVLTVTTFVVAVLLIVAGAMQVRRQ